MMYINKFCVFKMTSKGLFLLKEFQGGYEKEDSLWLF